MGKLSGERSERDGMRRPVSPAQSENSLQEENGLEAALLPNLLDR